MKKGELIPCMGGTITRDIICPCCGAKLQYVYNITSEKTKKEKCPRCARYFKFNVETSMKINHWSDIVVCYP